MFVQFLCNNFDWNIPSSSCVDCVIRFMTVSFPIMGWTCAKPIGHLTSQMLLKHRTHLSKVDNLLTIDNFTNYFTK